MTWAKKGTRRVTVRGETYLWKIRDWELNTVATIGQQSGKHVLHIDIQGNFTDTVKKGIEWALDQGWSTKMGPSNQPRIVVPTSNGFEWKVMNEDNQTNEEAIAPSEI